MQQPIFMIGTQRSGSNLLRLMLNQLSEIASPHPPHILERLSPLLKYYGDLYLNGSFHLLAEDVCQLVELNPVAWEGVRLDVDDVLSRCRENSLVALHGAVYDVCAESWNAQTWCCKSLANINYVEEIERYFDDPRYIFLYRDGRDVALSFQKAVVGEKHIYHIAKGWAKTQERALTLLDQIGNDRLIMVSYEELTTKSETTMRRLCEFLNVEYSNRMLEFHASDEARRAAVSSTLWNKVTQPVMQNNSKKFLRESSESEIRIFESIAGHVLDRLGYERVHVAQGEELTFSEQEIIQFSYENERIKKLLREQVNEDDRSRRERQENLLLQIKARTSERRILFK
jgi:hypothetical protein